jgi:serine/threonine protein kinase, bacterial
VSRRIGSSYLAHDVIGRGASGTVWRGAGPDGPVAIKVLRPELAGDEEIVARFLRERSLLTRLRHPHLVAVRDLVAEGDTLALILDLVEGPTLRACLDRSGALRPDEAAETVAGVSEALRVIHDAGVVHRDVKPENVLLAAAGHGTRPMLTDLGVALLAGCGRLTAPSGLVGTPDYVAPETISGARPTPAADVYATGVLLYELLAGRTPFGADHPAAVLYQ